MITNLRMQLFEALTLIRCLLSAIYLPQQMGHARLEETLDSVGGVLMLLTAVATLETCGTRGHCGQ